MRSGQRSSLASRGRNRSRFPSLLQVCLHEGKAIEHSASENDSDDFSHSGHYLHWFDRGFQAFKNNLANVAQVTSSPVHVRSVGHPERPFRGFLKGTASRSFLCWLTSADLKFICAVAFQRLRLPDGRPLSAVNSIKRSSTFTFCRVSARITCVGNVIYGEQY